MPTDIPPLVQGNFYHIYNRGNNRENVFPQERNYSYFMDLWWKHISPIAETWAYCLLKNHFHAVVYLKEQINLTGLTTDMTSLNSRVGQDKNPTAHHGDLSGFKKEITKEPSQYFSNFFNAYSRGLNIAIQRTGALFERPFKRIPIDNENYLMRLIVYVHQNPQKHGFVIGFKSWNYSSYNSIIGNNPTRLQRDKVLQLFGNREDFIRIHQEIQPLHDFEDEE
jgi:REP element-mobilizing transposase RayT